MEDFATMSKRSLSYYDGVETMSNSSDESSDGEQSTKLAGKQRRPTRQPKASSRNAIMARENRLKKKMYLSNLERHVDALTKSNKNLNGIMKQQSVVINDLRKELKYLKSVLRNSKDIGNLMRNINQSTGMSVLSSTTSNNLSLNDDCVPKQLAQDDSPSSGWLNLEAGWQLDFPIPDNFSDNVSWSSDWSNDNQDHKNYCAKTEPEDTDDDVGVCLHVSKGSVSLEFCQKCSENRSKTST